MLTSKLWKHQQKGLECLEQHDGFMLALDMATGKSLIVVAYVEKHNVQRTLIVCPKAVQTGWTNQWNVHTDSTTMTVILKGSTAEKAQHAQRIERLADAMKKRLVIITNYDSVYRSAMSAYILSRNWDMVVADESHKLKAPGGVGSRFMARVTPKAKKRVLLTGTPWPNTILDAYAQYRFMDPTVFGKSFNMFRNRYAIMGGYNNHEVTGWKNKEEFTEKFFSKAYRVVSDDVLDLPPVFHVPRTCQIGPAATKAYKEMRKNMCAALERGEISASNALVRSLRLSQITGGTVNNNDGESIVIDHEKIDLLEEVLDEIEKDSRVVVFARFTPDVQRCKSVLERIGRKCGELSGHRDDLAAYKAGEIDSIVVQIQAGNAGVELHLCGECSTRYAIYFSLDYSLGNYQQSLKRVNRPGREGETIYVHLIAEKTIDELIYQRLTEKDEDNESFLRALMREDD